jgi:hypothetical protein
MRNGATIPSRHAAIIFAIGSSCSALALTSDRGSIVVDSLTLMDAVAYLKMRLPTVLPPRVEEYMRL